MAFSTTINIQTQKGLIDIATFIKAVAPTLSQPSAIDQFSMSVGNGFKTGKFIKRFTRTQTEYNPATLIGDIAKFAEATSQAFAETDIVKTIRQDNIVISKLDVAKLEEGKDGGGTIAKEAANFILTGKELDLKQAVSQIRDLASKMKLYSSVTTVQTGDKLSIVPAGAQPVQADFTFAGAIGNIQKGGRITQYTDDGNFTGEKRAEFVKAMIAYLNTLGTDRNTGGEVNYPFSVNGIPLSNLAIFTDYANATRLTNSFTTNFVSITSPNQKRIVTGLIGFYDSLPVHLSNQFGAKNLYTVASDRVWVRDLDPEAQYLGVVREAASIVVKGGTAVNLAPSDLALSLLQGRTMGPAFFEEFMAIDFK